MNKKQIADKVIEIIADEMSLDENDVKPTLRFVEDLGADSLDVVEMVMCFEEEFEIEIPDQDAEQVKTVSDAIALTERLVNEAV